jgi:uncharacterized membrane protein
MAAILYLVVPLAVVIIVAAVTDRRRRRALTGREISEDTARAITEARYAERIPRRR